MEPTTLRLPEDLAEDLADEAEDRGYSSRSEYIRRILRNRSDGDPDTETAADRHRTDYASEYDVPALAERVAELEARVGALEADREPTAGDRDEDSEATGQPPETDAVDPDEFRVGEGAVERADVRAAVEAVADGWADSDERLRSRKAAAEAVLAHAVETGEAIGKSEAIDGFHDEYAVEGQSAETWWRKNIRPVLKAAGEYSNSAHGYVVDRLDAR